MWKRIWTTRARAGSQSPPVLPSQFPSNAALPGKRPAKEAQPLGSRNQWQFAASPCGSSAAALLSSYQQMAILHWAFGTCPVDCPRPYQGTAKLLLPRVKVLPTVPKTNYDHHLFWWLYTGAVLLNAIHGGPSLYSLKVVGNSVVSVEVLLIINIFERCHPSNTRDLSKASKTRFG